MSLLSAENVITNANLLHRQVLESRTVSSRPTSDHVRSVSTCSVFRCLPADALNPSKLSFLSVYFLARPGHAGSLGFSRMKSGSHNIVLIPRGTEGCIIIADLELA